MESSSEESQEVSIPEIINSGQALVVDFEPTPAQQLFLDAALNPEIDVTVKSWCEHAKVTVQSYNNWRKNPDFLAWFIREFETSLALRKMEWLKIGLKKMEMDRETWKAMGEFFYPNGIEEPVGDGSQREQLEAVAISLMKRYSGKN